MIKRIFRNLFGRKSEVKPASGAVENKASSEPKDEVVKGPTLPVERGFTFTREMGRRNNPRGQDLKAETLEHLWSGKALAGKAHKAHSMVKSEVRAEERLQRNIDKHIAKDQSPADFDDREGHVVVPSSLFEYHGDRETLKFPGTGGKGTRNGSIHSLETPSGLIHFDTESKDYNYQPHQTPVTTGTDYSSHTQVLASGEFQISKDGTVTLPSASSLEGARAIEEQRELAQNAQYALGWAQNVSDEAAYRVDGFEFDHDPRRNHTVASNLDEYWFLRKNSLPHMQHQSYSVESGPNGTRLYEDSYGKQPELLLNMTHDENVTSLETSFYGRGSLHVTWDKQAGTVKAERRAEQGRTTAEPTPEPRHSSSRSYDRDYSSYKERPRSQRDPNALPRDFTSSGRIRSHGGGHHKMVKATGRFPNDQTMPEKFTDPDTGKSYRKTSYRKLDGSQLYVER